MRRPQHAGDRRRSSPISPSVDDVAACRRRRDQRRRRLGRRFCTPIGCIVPRPTAGPPPASPLDAAGSLRLWDAVKGGGGDRGTALRRVRRREDIVRGVRVEDGPDDDVDLHRGRWRRRSPDRRGGRTSSTMTRAATGGGERGGAVRGNGDGKGTGRAARPVPGHARARREDGDAGNRAGGPARGGRGRGGREGAPPPPRRIPAVSDAVVGLDFHRTGSSRRRGWSATGRPDWTRRGYRERARVVNESVGAIDAILPPNEWSFHPRAYTPDGAPGATENLSRSTNRRVLVSASSG